MRPRRQPRGVLLGAGQEMKATRESDLVVHDRPTRSHVASPGGWLPRSAGSRRSSPGSELSSKQRWSAPPSGAPAEARLLASSDALTVVRERSAGRSGKPMASASAHGLIPTPAARIRAERTRSRRAHPSGSVTSRSPAWRPVEAMEGARAEGGDCHAYAYASRRRFRRFMFLVEHW